ncbi:MAG TPA: tRNA 2-selenouridine(34) synthase MnmH, partial [Chryseosolibacter sp.]|nr:tRNA 2-selenouridine(34) synthase MnmH [Chryseosolibacter sp.]
LPAIDVRSENEFLEGHIPGAVNIPILNNEERIQVGTDYKQRGQMEAIKTGFKLVGPRIADIVDTAEKAAGGRDLLVHCWRGGMRSSNFCLFVGMAKIKTHQLIGGYKFYRQKVNGFFSLPFKFNVIGGYTGSGKSEALRALRDAGEQVIDLEALANHKGSVFGGLMMPAQPTTEQFQNDLFEEIRKLDVNRPVWIEDESITIGRVVLPDPLWKSMCVGRIIQLDVSKEDRINRLVNDYGPADREQFLQAMGGIVKKLGGQHYQAAREKLLAGDMASTIDILLTYYDKAYSTGLSKKQERVTDVIPWKGENVKEVVEALKHIHA